MARRVADPVAGYMPTMARHSHLRRWGAAYLLFALFLASWVAQFVAMLVEVGNEARQHGEAFSLSEFWPQFWAATFENWQSEWLQLFLQAVILLGMKHVLFKADAEDMEQVQMDLAEIKEHLGIPPRDEATRQERDDAAEIRARSAEPAAARPALRRARCRVRRRRWAAGRRGPRCRGRGRASPRG